MPVAEYLGSKGSDYTMVVGAGVFKFTAGEPKEVSPAVALRLGKVTDGQDQPLFRIDEMPEIVEHNKEEKQSGDGPKQLSLLEV